MHSEIGIFDGAYQLVAGDSLNERLKFATLKDVNHGSLLSQSNFLVDPGHYQVIFRFDNPEGEKQHIFRTDLRVEPFLTVYGQTEESLEIKEDVRKMEARIVDLNKEIADHKRATENFQKENLIIQRELQLLKDILDPLQPMLEFANSFESPSAMMEFLNAIKERSVIARQRAESMPQLSRKAKELLQEAISDIIQKESKRVKQLLARKTGITDEDILQAAILAAKESIEEEYGVSIGDN